MRSVIFFLAIIVLGGCENIIFDEKSFDTPENVFEVCWQELDRHYSFFPYLNLDWDSVYLVYKPKIMNGMSDAALFSQLAKMSNLLKDGHVNLFNWNSISSYAGWYDKYPLNQINIKRYLEAIQYPNNIITYAKIRSHNIGYLTIKTFGGDNEYFRVVDQFVEKYSNTDGIIIDVRSNGGGSSINADTIASRFTDTKYFTVKSRYRNGPGHNDFTEWIDRYVQPAGKIIYTKPVAVLTNRRCFSATEGFLADMDVLPNVTIIGDTSGGGSGNPIQKILPNGWLIRLSNSQAQLPSGRDYQFTGIYPDEPVWISRADSASGVDTILETAIGIIESSK